MATDASTSAPTLTARSATGTASPFRRRPLAVAPGLGLLEPVLGAVASCYVLESGRYVAVRMENLPSTNAVTINVGYVYVTFAALSAANTAGVDPDSVE